MCKISCHTGFKSQEIAYPRLKKRKKKIVDLFSKFCKILKIQLESFVDFEKCCKMSTNIWLQKSASIQPRTSLLKVCKPCKIDQPWCRARRGALLRGAAHHPHGHARAAASACRSSRLVLGWIDADFRVQIRIF